jgi:hypothetical protein
VLGVLEGLALHRDARHGLGADHGGVQHGGAPRRLPL